MKCMLFILICLFGNLSASLEQDAFQYLLDEVEQDAILTHEEQNDKVQEFKDFANQFSPEVASRLTNLLLQETRIRILDMLQNAGLDSVEIDAYLSDFEKIIQTSNMSVEFARQMLFFVAELKIHRHYVYEFGVALGCPQKQLLRHDLCKLSFDQFEGYARYFRGGRLAEDKPGFLASWQHHQHEEHHLESYSIKGFDFDRFPKDRLKNNMLEIVADWLAAAKQRGGGSLTHHLVKVLPKRNYDPRLFPYLEEALLKAHALHLMSHEDPDSLFKDFPCWNSEVEQTFRDLQAS